MNKKDGKYFEHLVELIERSIDPDAKIEQDVQMPILNSINGYTTQCDIVITKGKKPRETITIIEVQDRNSKIKPNDYRGWIQKLDEIGAQHLICVSRQNFPASIIEKVSMSGNKVSLIKLSELDIDNIPIDFFGFKSRYVDFQILKVVFKKTITNKHQISATKVKEYLLSKEAHPDNKIFTYDKTNLISLYELVKEYNKTNENGESGRSLFQSNFDSEKCLYLTYKKEFIQVGLEVEYDWKIIKENLPVSLMSYEQNEYGTLAWVLKTVYKLEKDTVILKIPVTKKGKKYIMKNIEISTIGNPAFSLEMNIIKNS
ncbi:hypothetical protein SAMN05444411_106209 [Lutibacter oricola]|uniref:Uncharacterized protein n=1 Tax=Lutibacter oricola TaxID=762486 RepID=A0A1H3CMY7_9FLAO|nr:hypothetical protein [Lutibacter oricola]SDX55475.1 hypothetical protein SAMN05444411_106209 [Lutibacter oricola]